MNLISERFEIAVRIVGFDRPEPSIYQLDKSSTQFDQHNILETHTSGFSS